VVEENNTEQFDPYVLIDELIEEMGIQNEDPVKLAGLKEAMFEALGHQLFNAAAENIEDEVIDAVMDDLKDEKDAGFILRELMQASPGAQLAMLGAVKEFKENTLEAFNKLKT
jgi:hypothetical protein